MKITIYELLGMVKDDKAPKTFKYDSYVWTYNYESSAYWNGKGEEFEDYMDDGLMEYLNDEVEIIEPQEHKIPEKLTETTLYGVPILNKKELSNITLTNKRDIVDIKDKINEILDYLEVNNGIMD